MTDKEMFAELATESPLNCARRAFSSACGRIDQAGRQRQPLSPITMRKMEFEAVLEIAKILGVPVRS